MKKMMIIVAVMMLAVSANAATYLWKVSTRNGVKLYHNDATTLYSGSVSIMAYLTSSTASSAVNIFTATAANGVISATTFDTADTLTPPGAYNVFLTYSDELGNVFTSGNIADRATDALAETSIVFTNAHISAGTWTTAAVPEPTSGLLLLCGLAGLALRRKRA